jgi:transposase
MVEPLAVHCPRKRIDEDERRSSSHRGKVRGTPRGHPYGAADVQREEDRPMGAYYVGLDVHSRETVFVIQDEAGSVVARGAVPTTPEGLARLCREHQLAPGTAVGLAPVVVDAHEVRRKAHRPTQKSDRRDAFEVCDGIRRGLYRSVVHIPSPAISTLRTTLSRRRHFIRIQTAEVNAAKRLLRGAGWLAGTRTSLRSAISWDRLLSALAAVPELEGHVRLHYAVWQQAGEQVRALDHQLADLARPLRDEMRRLETVPGVGPVVALTALAVFADVQRFASAKHVASYAGLVPSTYQSGDRDRHGHIRRAAHYALRGRSSCPPPVPSAPSVLPETLQPPRLQDRDRRGGPSAVPTALCPPPGWVGLPTHTPRC